LALCLVFALAQVQEETFEIYAEHPRIFLRPPRLKLLKRERERRSLRWQQFETLLVGKAPMPEPGFAKALFYRVADHQETGKEAVAWALNTARENSPADLRQMAIVFDWCQDLLSGAQSQALAAKLRRGSLAAARSHALPAIRSRLLAAIALEGDGSRKELEQILTRWWQSQTAPALKSGRNPIPRDDTYALMEILHAVRDTLNIDLRDSAPAFFKTLPIFHLVSYYPAVYPAPENEFRIPAAKGSSDPDLRHAALSRAAELSMVAYDTNAPESQVLQGWLLHDHFLMRGTFGITYEFLWANPYQPGLSYYHVPLVFHDDLNGRLFVRSSWEDSATWLGFFDGELQLFRDGKVTVLNPQLTSGPLSLEEAVVFFGNNARKFRVLLNAEEQVFVLGLKPRQKYDVEVDDEGIREERTDPGGILALKLPHKIEIGVRMKESGL